MYKYLIITFSIGFVTQTFGSGLKSINPKSIQANVEKIRKLGNKTSTPAQRAQYIKELYYSVNGYPAGTDTSNKADPHLQLFNQILGANGVGGILFSEGYENCSDIPSSGSASGSVPRAGTLNLTFGTATKTVPSYYLSDAGTSMDKRIVVSGAVSLEIELKCNTNTQIQTGYVKMTWTEYSVVYEGYFQKNGDTGAVNVDMYVKTQAGGGQNLLIPTQFSTSDGDSFRLFSGYVYLSGGGGNQDYLVGVNGVANGKAQMNFLQTTDTSGSPVTTAPNNFGSLSSAGGTVVATECIDVPNETTTTGCTAVPAPGSLTIGGTTSTWTLTSLKAVSL